MQLDSDRVVLSNCYKCACGFIFDYRRGPALHQTRPQVYRERIHNSLVNRFAVALCIHSEFQSVYTARF